MISAAVIISQVPPGWVRIPDEADGVPLWQWHEQAVYAATRDMDQLLFPVPRSLASMR